MIPGAWLGGAEVSQIAPNCLLAEISGAGLAWLDSGVPLVFSFNGRPCLYSLRLSSGSPYSLTDLPVAHVLVRLSD